MPMKFTTRSVTTNGNMFPISQPQPESTKEASQPPPYRPHHQHQHAAIRRLSHFRTVVIPILLIFIFTSLILGSIYAYCVAKPHTDIADRLAQNSTAEADGSLFGKRSPFVSSFTSTYPSASTSTQTHTSTSISTSGLSHTLSLKSRSPTSNGTDTTSGTDSTSESTLPLLFYTLTTPGTSLLHLMSELLVHHHTPHHLLLRTPYLVLMAVSSLVLAGWITTLGFWIHCELPSIHTSHTQSQSICPVQIRGHFMYGIHEVSIAKAVIGCVVVIGYLCHITLLTLGAKVQRRRVWKFARGEGEGELEHGEACEVVVVRIEEEGNADTKAEADTETDVKHATSWSMSRS